MVTSITSHQGFQPFPKLESPFVDSNGRIAKPWHRFLQTLWQRTGSGSVSTANAITLSKNPTTGFIDVIDATGTVLGQLSFGNTQGGAAQPQTLTTSPFVFTFPSTGRLGIDSGLVEISRNNGSTWQTVSRVGGLISLTISDKVRVTWYGGTIPGVVFYPGSG